MPIANVNGINIDYKVEGEGEALIMISARAAMDFYCSTHDVLVRP